MINNKAILYSAFKPDKKQEQGFKTFLNNKYNEDILLEWVEDKSLNNGFKLEVGDEVFDWSEKGLYNQLLEQLSNIKYLEKNTIPLIKKELKDFELKALPEEIGKVISIGDNIATIEGLDNARYGEILVFEDGTRGMVLNLTKKNIGCILFDLDGDISSSSKVRRTNKTASMPVGEEYLGRVVNALGVAIDGNGEIKPSDYMPIENKAPGIVSRSPVKTPLYTGILSIDSMFPIGRGQRELIIGDRQTGKSAIAIDTIINQKGKDCICIYVAIGQKSSSVARVYEELKKHNALEYTTIVAACASEADTLQYIAPYSGCALAEYFMNKGKDVLIVYDDLSKHAVAYRTISLLLDRSPGREAYPGDVFYLHSRLLERSAKLNDENGGGSITALPIVETLEGDVSAYIPTNIISITDGQIYLESNLFFSGQRPAVNVGLSVSRVGGDAQTKAMKKAAGTLRLDLAQYREMEVFTQFSSDLDDDTKKQLAYGEGLMYMLRQKQYSPYSHHQQVVILVSALSHAMQDIEKEEVGNFLAKLIEKFENDYPDICIEIDSSKILSDETKETIIDFALKFSKDFK